MDRVVTELIRERYSCRHYQGRPIAQEVRGALARFFAGNCRGPLGNVGRFTLVAVTEEDAGILKGLGTYGFIKGATGYIVGAIEKGERDLEDYGYLLERAVLECTALGLGSCWLGGSLTKSSFAARIALGDRETMPAVAAVGYVEAGGREKDRVRKRAGADRRLPPSELFFDGRFGEPLCGGAAGGYAEALEMVRLAPSASNRQPWRVVRHRGGWHFYLQRTPGYGKGTLLFTVLGLADLQRVDLGIAMCHFELTARQMGLRGEWVVREPEIERPGDDVEYTATWLAP